MVVVAGVVGEGAAPAWRRGGDGETHLPAVALALQGAVSYAGYRRLGSLTQNGFDEDPACLLRAFLVCKAWGRAVSHPNFRRRLHELHRTPPVLGFFHDWRHECVPNFIPTTTSSFSLAAPDRRFWWALDSRHGRALFLSEHQVQDTKELLVWEPITGAQRRVPLPAAFDCSYPTAASDCSYPTAAVFCAADACDHRDCHGGPFHVVFVFTESPESEYDSDDEGYITSACIYSSETGT
ncbi:hypothetical protein ACQ4PT_031201 [Festuca glaucescens]